MTDLLDEKITKLFALWDSKFDEIKSLFKEFSETITEYDQEKDASKELIRDDVIDIYDKLVDEYNELKDEVNDNFEKEVYDLEQKFEFLKELYTKAKDSKYLEKGEKTGKEARDELKTNFNYGDLTNTELKQNIIRDLNEINKYLEGVKKKFKADDEIFNYKSTIERI